MKPLNTCSDEPSQVEPCQAMQQNRLFIPDASRAGHASLIISHIAEYFLHRGFAMKQRNEDTQVTFRRVPLTVVCVTVRPDLFPFEAVAKTEVAQSFIASSIHRNAQVLFCFFPPSETVNS